MTAPRRDDFTIDAQQALEAVERHHPSVVFIASPNNPTGTAIAPELVSKLHDAMDGIVVVDEAYAEFRRVGTPSALELLDAHPRLIVTRTMSKAFAYAGARLGYAAAAREIVDFLRVVRLPYHLSAVTQAVAGAALAHSDDLLARVSELRTRRDELVLWLRSHGFDAADSDANFVLFGRFPLVRSGGPDTAGGAVVRPDNGLDRHEVWQGLLDRGVLIREVGPAGWLRVSIGTDDEIRAFQTALTEVLDL